MRMLPRVHAHAVLFAALAMGACQHLHAEPIQTTQPVVEKICAVDLNLRLADSPGPSGHALAYTPWKIAKGRQPRGLGVIDTEDELAAGETDEDGRIHIDPVQKENVLSTLCTASGPAWLVYPGQSVQIKVSVNSGNWSKDEELFHTLQAQDYFQDIDDYSPDLFFTVAGMESLLEAMRAYGVNSVSELREALHEAHEENESDQ